LLCVYCTVDAGIFVFNFKEENKYRLYMTSGDSSPGRYAKLCLDPASPQPRTTKSSRVSLILAKIYTCIVYFKMSQMEFFGWLFPLLRYEDYEDVGRVVSQENVDDR
jgi:hypothetical protein